MRFNGTSEICFKLQINHWWLNNIDIYQAAIYGKKNKIAVHIIKRARSTYPILMG